MWHPMRSTNPFVPDTPLQSPAAEEAAAAAAAAMGEDAATGSAGGHEDGEKGKKFSGKALRHALGLSNFWGKKKTAKPPAPPKPILLVAKCEISLGIFDGTCERNLAVTCPDVETCPPQCIVVGAGQSAVNGTYDMQGFRHDSPWYVGWGGGVDAAGHGRRLPPTATTVTPPERFHPCHCPSSAPPQ